ncbi:MAG: hypothetical protein BM563_09910 [Bacteroidetes bacterium MedPE-SWsnd-G1]|nr:MAG: hypothetical protein BM563_09910 [Bacteroidetes bacterium MedPE-SWsnd-G1]
MENKIGKYFKYAIGEIVLVVIGILIALQINNWNQERIIKKNIEGSLELVHKELLGDILALESEVRNRTKKHQLMSKALHIIEEETSLSIQNRQLLDSAFFLYTRFEARFNNTRTYESFLSTESTIIDNEIYSNLNKYLDEFNEVNARVERMAVAISSADYDILMNTSITKKSSGEYEYSFKTIQHERDVYEIIRHSKQSFQAIVNFYSKLLEKAIELERMTKTNKSKTE